MRQRITNRRHQAIDAKPERRRLMMLVDQRRERYYWCTKSGEYVRLDKINEYGIRAIYNLLCDQEDTVPYCWIMKIREHAASRGIDLSRAPAQGHPEREMGA
jgi:hypothetical protein